MKRSSGFDIAFPDLLINVLGTTLLLIVVLMTVVSVAKKQSEADSKERASLLVEARWDDASCADVDLWIKTPDDRPVGYRHKSGQSADLLRDDLGCTADLSGLNYENLYVRTSRPGEYQITVMLYRSGRTGEPPPRVYVTVSTRHGDGALKVLWSRWVELPGEGQEVTAVRFTLTARGELVTGSMNTVHREILK